MQYALENESIAYPFDFWSLIEMDATHTWFDDYVYERMNNYTSSVLRKLDIWDDDFLHYYKVKDPRKLVDRMVHKYLHCTSSCNNNIIIRAIDKILKKVY